MYSKMKKEITESQVNFCNTSQISVPVSSVNWQNLVNWGRERVQGRNSFPQRSTPSSRALYCSPFLGQKTHSPCKTTKYRSWWKTMRALEKKSSRLQMLPAVPICAGASSRRGSHWRAKSHTVGCPSSIYMNICVASNSGPKANLWLVEEGFLLQRCSPQAFVFTKPYLIGMNWGTASRQDTTLTTRMVISFV